MNEIEIGTVVVGVVEVLKNLGLPSKYCQLTTVVLAIGLSLLLNQPTLDNAIKGLVVGLTATGLYGAAANVASKRR